MRLGAQIFTHLPKEWKVGHGRKNNELTKTHNDYFFKANCCISHGLAA